MFANARDYTKPIPDDLVVECFAATCGERATISPLTPWGRGAFCDHHGQLVIDALPDEAGPARVDEFPGGVKDSFVLLGYWKD